jgi:hypothetical protein
MLSAGSSLLQTCLKAGAFALVANEIRGIALAAPVLISMYERGGTWMTLWLGFSALVGIAVSVAIPALALHKLRVRTIPAN